MIELKCNCDIDASALAVQMSAAKELVAEIQADKMGGWFDLPEMYDKDEYERIMTAAERICESSEYLVCIGIGGSYLGHRSVIEALGNKSGTKILYAGNSLSTLEIREVFEEIGDADFSVNVISKSGTTTEPAIAFRIFREKLIEKYGREEACHRIYATTDENKGALHDEALYNHYERFVVPDNVGGRFSVLTAVGLLPMAVAGIDISELLAGACEEKNSEQSDIYKYATMRHIMRTRGYDTEVLTSFHPEMRYFQEWWKQLFGESEGKHGGGIFPASMLGTTDLHSLGQYMQDGRENIFETFLGLPGRAGVESIGLTELPDDADGLNYLAGHSVEYVNEKAYAATVAAHSKHIPVVEIYAPELSERTMGALIYFFELSCAISARLQGVNPFDQPGVEAYKKEMFKLLGRP